MALLNIQDVKKFYGRQDVLRKAAFHVNSGEKVGLIGPNGAGKSTLLRLILGDESPDEGQVHKAKGLRLGYLPQDLMSFSGQNLLEMVMDTAENLRAIEAELALLAQEIEEAARHRPVDEEALLELTNRQSSLLELFEGLGGYTLESEAKKILDGLGFRESDFSRPIEAFSGGWIMRAVLARLLLAQPDILLLDEPTNHLDMDSLLWLESYLKSSASALILVSHDRVFLNNVALRIVEVERGEAFSYSGNYDRYLDEKEKRKTTQAAAYASQQDRIKQIERYIEKNRVRASTARRAQSRVKMLERMEKLEAPVQQQKTFKLSLPEPARGPDMLVELSDITKSYGSNTVYRNLDFAVRRNDRIAILGPNGQGKSTLVKLLAGRTDIQSGTRRVGAGVIVSYFTQFQLEDLNPDRTIIEELDAVAGDLTPGRLRSILGGFLFQGDDVFKKVAVLSGGEKSRLIMAKMMLVAPNLLLLDEPSNHLDIPGREMLEQALKQYTGTICLISHDRRLINAVANKVVVINHGRVESFPGNFNDYGEIWQERLNAPQIGAASVGGSIGPDPTPLKIQSRANREAQKKAAAQARQRLYSERAPLLENLKRLEKRQEELGGRLEEITAALAEPDTYQDPERSKDLNLEYSRLKAEMDETTAAWEGAAMKLEEIEADQSNGI